MSDLVVFRGGKGVYYDVGFFFSRGKDLSEGIL